MNQALDITIKTLSERTMISGVVKIAATLTTVMLATVTDITPKKVFVARNGSMMEEL